MGVAILGLAVAAQRLAPPPAASSACWPCSASSASRSAVAPGQRAGHHEPPPARIVATTPIFAALLGRLVLVTPGRLARARHPLAAAGVLIVVARGDLARSPPGSSARPATCSSVQRANWAVFTVLSPQPGTLSTAQLMLYG
jgi:hypothetical protein